MSVWLSVCRDTETGLFSLFSCQDHLLKADRSPRSLSTVISLERTGPASYFWAGVDGAPYRSTSIPAARRDTASLETLLLTVCRFFPPHFQGKSSGTAMRSFAAFLIFFSGVGFIGCKPSSPCPSGQFMLKSQCVLCHPTCSECDGHELFECTTCGVSEYNYLCPY